MKHIWKKSLTLSLFLILGLFAAEYCGSHNIEASQTSSADQNEAPAASLSDSVSRLISFYQTEDGTYFMIAYKPPRFTGKNYDVLYDIVKKPLIDGNSLGFEDRMDFYHGCWNIIYAYTDGRHELENIALSIKDKKDQDAEGNSAEKLFTYTKTDMVSAEEYPDFGLYPLGNRYVTMEGSLAPGEYNNEHYFGFRVHLLDVDLLDQNSGFQEKDIHLENFKFYAGDGTSAEEFFNLECNAGIHNFSNSEQMTNVELSFEFYPPQATDESVEELIHSILETNPYFTYSDSDGNVYTIPL